MAASAVVVHHPMHTARASYVVQHDYKGQYAALPNLATADRAPPPPPPAAAAAAGALDRGMSPAAALVDSWRNKHAVVGGAADDPPAEPDSYHRPGRKSSSPYRTPSTASRSRRPPPPGAASSFDQVNYPGPNQHRYSPPPPPPVDLPPPPSSSHHHLPPPPPRHPAAQQQQQRGQAHPSHAYQQASRYSAPAPSRSQPASAAATGSSNRTSRQPHRNRDRDRDRERQHHVPYDADYDRQLASPGQPNLGAAATSSSSSAATAAAAAAASRGLFDPRGGSMPPSSSSAAPKRHTAGGGSSSSPRRSQTGEGRSSRTRHGSSATSTVHPLPLPERGNPIPRPSSRAGDDRRPPTRSKREPVQLADLGRRAGTTTTAATTTTTLHRGGGGGIPTPYDAKDSRESLESLGTDFSGRTKSSGGGGGRRRRRADAADGADDEGIFDPSNAGGASGAAAGGGAGMAGVSAGGGGGGKNRQLFDPRKDDPMRFTVARPSAGVSSASQQQQAPPAYASTAGFTGSTFTLQTESVMNLASPRGTAAAADDASSVRTGASGHHDAHPSAPSSSSSKRPDHPILAELKKAYRGILELEKKLQDEHRTATNEVERAAEDAAAANGSEGVQIQGQGKKYDDEYWVKLAKAHKQLAEAHYSFLQMSLDPHIPAGLHSLPQRYNIPTRLWQVAFHQLLERMRHAVISAPVPAAGGTEGTNVLDHLIEFIQFAYTHYSQLFEDPAVGVFRAAWIEQLGDLARYRMAVAGLASRVHAAQAVGGGGVVASSLPSSPGLDSLDDLELDVGDGVHAAAPDRNPPPHRRPADAASIGQAALNDWDLEERETWREMAREWYALGLAENPGTGRLQHHLALLSKGDELRALYHYSKSLTTAHPYLSARESILPLFEEEHQARRTQSDVSQHELFVHLHGMLFTKISLDDFDECLERFLERLRQEGWALNKARDGTTTTTTAHLEDAPVFGDREWCMLGVINIAALLQYGTEDGVLRKLMTPETGDKAEASTSGATMPSSSSSSSKRHASKYHGRHESNRAQPADRSRSTPQALMVKRNDGDGSVASPSITDNLEDDGSEFGFDADDVVKQLQPAGSTEPEDDPLPFKLAQRLAFSILSTVLEMPFFRIGTSEVPNPYVTILCTFLGHVSHHPAAMRHLERSIPWDALATLFNRVSSPVEIRLETPNKLVGGKPLPEDHCLRGMEWAGRQLFGRGYWREPRSRSNAASPASGFGDVAVAPPIEGVEGTTIRVESEADALRFDLTTLRGAAAPAGSGIIDDGDGQSAFHIAVTALSEGRWRRLAICAAWLVRNVPGFDYDVRAVDPRQRFQVSGALRQKLERWRREDEEAREAERLSRLALEDRNIDAIVEDGTDGDESDEEDFEDENDSEEVKALKARRRQLKSIIRQARASTRAPRGQKSASMARFGSKAAAAIPRVFPGYTVLVFDTNILLTSIALLSELVAAECWTIVIPLAVVTELDGIKRNSTPLGVAASEAIDYLEQAVRGYSRHLKIQTSRGNYLKDLSIRNEAIDFDGADPASSHDFARSLDDVILRAASWQKEHFSNRLALVNPRAIAAQRIVPSDTAPVVLVTFDRNLRLKASARGVEATDEKGLKKAIDSASSGNG